MRRVVFGVVAGLLTWAAVETRPVHADDPVTSFCDPEACRSGCIAQGYIDGACIGKITKFCGCLQP